MYSLGLSASRMKMLTIVREGGTVSRRISTWFHGVRLRLLGTFYRVIAAASRVIGADFECIETVRRFIRDIEYACVEYTESCKIALIISSKWIFQRP